jgi:hypothetical protein
VEYQGAGGATTAGDHWASYHFTGGNWYGTVEESSILITLHLPGTHLVAYDPQLRRKGNRISGKWQRWNAQGGVAISHAPAIQGALLLEGPLQTDIPGNLEYVFFKNNKQEKGLFVSEQPGNTPDEYAWGPVVLQRKEGVFIRSDVLSKFPGVKDLVVKTVYGGNQYYPREITIVGHDTDKKLSFRVGITEATLADGRTLLLQKPPFIKRIMNDSVMYVPFEPVSDVFGSLNLTVNRADRRASIEFVQK